MYKVLIIDDQTISRQLFESLVAASGRYEVAAALPSAKMADVYCASGKVDLILMDVMMKDGYNGLEAAESIRQSYPDIKIIIMTSMPDAKILAEAKRVGVESFWYKEAQSAPLLEVMDQTMNGGHMLPDAVPQTKLGQADSSELTEREQEVLRLLSKGYTDKEIADQLHIGLTTVRYHVSNLSSKTGFSSRTELAVAAVQAGITIL